MADGNDNARLKIEREKEKLRLKERLINEKEKQRRAKRFIDIGRIAGKVDIDLLDNEILLGAFIEISEKLKDSRICAQWKDKASVFMKKQDENNGTPLSICFSADPEKGIKEKLKELGFRWNAFRKEFFGHGNTTSIEELLKGTQFKIEIIG